MTPRSTAKTEIGTGSIASKGDILKNDLVMSAAGDCKRATEQQNQVQHAVDSVVPHR